MRISIFVAAAGRQASGPETYEHCLLRALAAIDQETDYRIFCFNQAAADSFQINQPNIQFEILRPNVRWISLPFSLPRALSRSGVQLCHATFVPPPRCPTPLMMTLHGSDMFVHPEFFQAGVRWRLNALLARGFRRARLIVCVSQHVRDMVQQRFQVPDERLAVVYHGIDSSFRPLPPIEARGVVRERYGITRPYVLYVGKIVASKNVPRLVEAFVRFRRACGSDVLLVMAGKSYPRMSRVDESVWRSSEKEGVLRIGQVPHRDLPWLYGGALAFAFPSLWEGFGLPIVEAMACGVPVITSAVSCLPEVAGGAALLVDPHSVSEIEAALHRACFDQRLRAELIAKGLHRSQDFSWLTAAQQTRAAYLEVVNQGAN